MSIEQGLRGENENLKRLLEQTERERDEALSIIERLRNPEPVPEDWPPMEKKHEQH